MYSRTPTCRVFMLGVMFGFLQSYFSLPQGYPYQWGGYVYYPPPYIPPHLPMYPYPESCCCFGYEIETGFPGISNQEINENGDIMPEIVTQITLTANHPTTTPTTIDQLTEGLRAETTPGISEEESSKFLQQTIIQSTTELSTTASESTSQSKTEFSTQSIAETNTEPITESSTIAPEGTESTSESAVLITETTAESIIKMTEYMQVSTTQSTTYESVSSTETAHLPETNDGSTAESSDPTARPTDKSTKEATESTTQITVDLITETPTASRVSTTDSIPNEDYSVGPTTKVSAESNGENYQHLNTASNSELTTENNNMLRSGLITENISDDNDDVISQTENYDFPFIDAA